jgi:hypothetical protein
VADFFKEEPMKSWLSAPIRVLGLLIVGSVIIVPWAGVATGRGERSSPSQRTITAPRSITLRAHHRGWPRLTFQDAADEDADAPDLFDAENRLAREQTSVVPLAESARLLDPRSLARGDLDGDGVGDVLILDRSGDHSHLVVREATTAGTLRRERAYELALTHPIAGVVDDFTLDGHLDVVVVGSSEGILLVGDGAGGFARRVTFSPGEAIGAVTSGDFTGDGRPDLILAAGGPARLILLRGAGSEGFGSQQTVALRPARRGGDPRAIRLADLNADGRLEVVVAWAGDAPGVTIFSGSADGTWRPLQDIDLPLASPPTDLAVADCDLDGIADIALSTATGDVFLIRGISAGSFRAEAVASVGGLPTSLVTGHFDADGYTDLALAVPAENRVVVLLGDGRGGFSSPLALDVESEPVVLMATRLNRDALDDIVIGKHSGRGLVLALTAASTITVTTAADVVGVDGRVSFREALLMAAQNPGPDVIAFNIPASEAVSGIFTITVNGALGPLPAVSDGGTTIDGTTQPGFAGRPLIVLNGQNAGLADGLKITSSLNVVAGLVINGFLGSGVKIIVDPPESSTATGNIVRGCYIGTDARGETSVGNGLFGILITRNRTQANIIGGTRPGDRNVISGNGSNGIELDFPTFGNLIQGNYIGTTADGSRPLPNGGDGVLISGARENQIGGREPGAGNVISGNTGSGVKIIGVSGNTVAGNFIGTDATGTRPVGNGSDGVSLTGEAHNNTVGGLSAGARNVISGNAANGVKIARGLSNEVIGNIIGTDRTGTAAIPNGSNGVLLTAGSQNNTVGGMDPAAANIIGGNTGDGITVAAASIGNVIAGNLIGTGDAQGTIRIGNGGSGVTILGAQNNAILGNTIAYNTGAAVQVLTSDTVPAQGNRISCNSTFANGGLGIDLNGDGVTLNDAGDVDDGPNKLMNFPVVTDISPTTGGVLLRGRLDTSNPAGARIEVFLADPDPSSFGEGKVCLTREVIPASDGTFAVTLAGVTPATALTLTATDESGNTSEFSRVAPPVDNQPPSVRVTAPNGGELVIAGTVVAITWVSSDNVGLQAHILALSLDSGQTCSIPIARVGGDVRAFAWLVPENLTSSTARVCVTAVDQFDNRATDTSDGDFVIAREDREPPLVRILSPNGGETIAAGSPFLIRWEASDNVGIMSCDVLFSADGGASFNPIAERLAGDVRSLVWNVPAGVTTTRGRILVRCRDLAGNLGQDNSDADFAVDSRPPTVSGVTVEDVNGPAFSFLARETITIRWTASDDIAIASQRIELSRDGGQTFEPLRDMSGNVVGDNIAPDARSFQWTIPVGTRTNDGRFRVTAVDRTGKTGSALSARIFIISSPF